MDHNSYRGQNSARDEEPFFRSDIEQRPQTRTYEPLRPEAGPWSVIKSFSRPLAVVGFLLTKFKGLLLLLLKVKFVGTALTMLLSIGAYALLFPVWFAVGFVVLIWVHEMGHVLQLKREGIKASAPMFIPFLGAFVAMKEMPKNALAEARVGLAGPVLGTLGALGVLGIYAATDEPSFLGLAYFGFLINLFNLRRCCRWTAAGRLGRCPPCSGCSGSSRSWPVLRQPDHRGHRSIGSLAGPSSGDGGRCGTRRRAGRTTRYERGSRVAVGLVYFGLVIGACGADMAVTFVEIRRRPPVRVRTILYTGKGGVGKTSVAAATALKAAARGKKVLVMSTDPAHSLSDAFDTHIGPDPKEMATGVWAQEMDHTAMIEDTGRRSRNT